jgi:hypothetical protein
MRRSGSTRHGTRADGVDGRDVAKLRQLCENQQNRQELFAFGADATYVDTGGWCALRHDQKFVISASAASTSDGDPKTNVLNFVRRMQGRPGALPRGRRARRGLATRGGGPARLPGVRPSLRHLLRFTTLHADEAAQARDRRRARGATTASARADQSPPASPSTRRTQRWALRSCQRRAHVLRGRDHRSAGALRRPPTRQSVAPAPRRCRRKILSCALVAQFIPSLRARPRSNYDCA